MTLSPRQFELLSALRASDLDDPRRDAEVDALAAALSDPEEFPDIRELRRRNSEWDDAIRSALHEVAVPAGLRNRLRATLSLPESNARLPANSQPANSQQAIDGQNSVANVVIESKSNSGTTTSRRRWLQTIAAVGAATCAAAAGVWVFRGPQQADLDENDLLSAGAWLESEIRSDAWLNGAAGPNGVWSDADYPVNEFPLPAALRYHPLAWQPLQGSVLTHGAAYDFSSDPARPAALFVVPQPDARFSSRVPYRPQATTQGICVGFWQEGEWLFVLAATGTESRYRQFLSTQGSSPLA